MRFLVKNFALLFAKYHNIKQLNAPKMKNAIFDALRRAARSDGRK